MMPNFTFMSYAFGDIYIAKQKRLSEQIRAQGIDDIREMGPSDIDQEFAETHVDVLTAPKFVTGRYSDAGYCTWKPHVILKVFHTLNDGDILLYMDADDWITGPPRLKEYLVDKTSANRGFAGIALPRPNREWTKRDTFVLMGHDTHEYWESLHVEAGFIGLVKTDLMREFLETWLEYCTDMRTIGDGPNEFGPNLPGYTEHRFDQSIYSLLVQRYGFGTDRSGFDLRNYELEHHFNAE